MQHYLRHKAIRMANLSHTLSTGIHIEIKNSMEWTIYNDIFADGDYDEPILRLLESDETQSFNVLDLGSNVGFFTLRLLHLALSHKTKHRFTIQGIEANSALCDESQRRIQASKFPLDLFQITMTRGLIGEREGDGVLYNFKQHGLNSVFRKSGKPEPVPFINLEVLHPAWEKIHLLKCDIEGSEFSFIQNYPSLLDKTRIAVFEFHTEFCDYAACAEMIRARGFRHNKLIRKSPHSLMEFYWK